MREHETEKNERREIAQRWREKRGNGERMKQMCCAKGISRDWAEKLKKNVGK